MLIYKNGTGSAKAYSDLVEIRLTLTQRHKTNKDKMLNDYLVNYKELKTKITRFLETNFIDSHLNFIDYYSGEKTKAIEIINNGIKEYNYEHEYYYINGNFSLELPIIDNDRKQVAELLIVLEKFNAGITENNGLVNYHTTFTLSEELRAKLNAEATNNALDNIKIEIENIAGHLNYKNISLIEVDFNMNSRSNNNVFLNAEAKMRTGALSHEEKVKILDDMLEGKEIEVTSKFSSKWEIN